MQYTYLGRTGASVSRLCLGTMNFGPQTSEPDSYAIMDHALELGINFWDTADVYGWKKGEGVTEQIIGRYFAQGGGRREKVVIATKVYGDMGDWPNTSRLSALHIRRACEDSLRRLKTDYIDLYQMHHVWREAPWEEIWQAMELLVQQGKVLYVGSSNFAGWHIAQANEAAEAYAIRSTLPDSGFGTSGEAPVITFSPDSKQAAYPAIIQYEDEKKQKRYTNVMVRDGVEQTRFAWVSHAPVFSPDSRHLVYLSADT